MHAMARLLTNLTNTAASQPMKKKSMHVELFEVLVSSRDASHYLLSGGKRTRRPIKHDFAANWKMQHYMADMGH